MLFSAPLIDCRCGRAISQKSKSNSPTCPILLVSLRLLYITVLIPPRIARTAGALVLASGGVVRGITNWGPYLLTKPVKSHAFKHDSGHHFIMRFDASPETQKLVYKTVATDPRMIRTGMVRMGKTLGEISKVGGRADWVTRNMMGLEKEFQRASGKDFRGGSIATS